MKSFGKVKIASFAVIVILAVMLVTSIPQAKAQFVLASWTYPDQYGQGIESFELFENSTGSWSQIGGSYLYDEANIFQWEGHYGSIKIRCYTWFNSTLAEVGSTNEGKLSQRHNVSVTQFNGSVVFSQQNFTYVSADDGIDPPLWLYGYDVILDFTLALDEYYTVTINYEVYY